MSLHDSLDSTGELLSPGEDSDTREEPGRNQGAEEFIETALPGETRQTFSQVLLDVAMYP